MEVDFEEWQWEEELTVFTLEHVGLGLFFEVFFYPYYYFYFLLALIINVLGLGISTIVFVIENIYFRFMN